MVQCEMCGTETATPKTVKVEGAELQVCGDCSEFGTEVQTEEPSDTSTKYSTSATGATSGSSGRSGSSGTTPTPSSNTRSRRDMFEEMDEIATDYDERIRRARESAGMSQTELADQLNEKASFIRKLERGESLPNDTIRRKLERALDIELVEGGSPTEDEEWSGDRSAGGMTLGDVVKRKD